MNKRIVVIGAQRSGTNLVSACLAHDKGLTLYNERDLGYSSCALTFGSYSTLVEFMNNTKEFVLQAPSLNVYCDQINDWLDEPVTFYWVNRDEDEVRQSRERVDWGGESKEMAKYIREWKFVVSDCKDSVEMSNLVFWNVQRYLLHDYKIVDYYSFKKHPLWKDERKELGIGEVR